MIRLQAVLAMVVVLVAIGPAAAQTTRQAARETDPIAALTTEFRALRAELAETARASLRLQLLVARVQAQEQRIIYLDRQRADAATRRSNAEQGREAVAAQMRQFTSGEMAKLPPEDRRQFEFMMEQQKSMLATQERAIQQMQVEENDAAGALAQEQARWGDLNARLDELERSLGR
jgi:hypothetical protein